MSIRSHIYNAALRANTRAFISWGLISRLASKRPHNKLWEGRLVDAPDPATPSRYTASTRRLGLRPAMLADDRISRRSSLSALSVILRLARPEGPRDRWLPSRPMSRDGIWPAGTSLSKLGDRLRRTSLPEVLHRCPLDSCRPVPSDRRFLMRRVYRKSRFCCSCEWSFCSPNMSTGGRHARYGRNSRNSRFSKAFRVLRSDSRLGTCVAIVQCAVSVEASTSTGASSTAATVVVVVSSHSIGSDLRVIARASTSSMRETGTISSPLLMLFAISTRSLAFSSGMSTVLMPPTQGREQLLLETGAHLTQPLPGRSP